MCEWDGSVQKAPRSAGEPVLYLDFDGVLHHEAVECSPTKGLCFNAEQARLGPVLFQHAPLLVDLLDPHPDIWIVLSTS